MDLLGKLPDNLRGKVQGLLGGKVVETAKGSSPTVKLPSPESAIAASSNEENVVSPRSANIARSAAADSRIQISIDGPEIGGLVTGNRLLGRAIPERAHQAAPQHVLPREHILSPVDMHCLLHPASPGFIVKDGLLLDVDVRAALVAARKWRESGRLKPAGMGRTADDSYWADKSFRGDEMGWMTPLYKQWLHENTSSIPDDHRRDQEPSSGAVTASSPGVAFDAVAPAPTAGGCRDQELDEHGQPNETDENLDASTIRTLAPLFRVYRALQMELQSATLDSSSASVGAIALDVDVGGAGDGDADDDRTSTESGQPVLLSTTSASIAPPSATSVSAGCSLQLASYDCSGSARYTRHCDAFKRRPLQGQNQAPTSSAAPSEVSQPLSPSPPHGQGSPTTPQTTLQPPGRVITAIFYPNLHWRPHNGGHLRVYYRRPGWGSDDNISLTGGSSGSASNNEVHYDIAPASASRSCNGTSGAGGGRFVVFRSEEVEHEVLPSHPSPSVAHASAPSDAPSPTSAPVPARLPDPAADQAREHTSPSPSARAHDRDNINRDCDNEAYDSRFAFTLWMHGWTGPDAFARRDEWQAAKRHHGQHHQQQKHQQKQTSSAVTSAATSTTAATATTAMLPVPSPSASSSIASTAPLKASRSASSKLQSLLGSLPLHLRSRVEALSSGVATASTSNATGASAEASAGGASSVGETQEPLPLPHPQSLPLQQLRQELPRKHQRQQQHQRQPRIFVSIPSFRDSECQHTLIDLFSKAAHPERIFVGLCWQYEHAGAAASKQQFPIAPSAADAACFDPRHSLWSHPDPRLASLASSNVRIITLDARFAQGPTLARHLCATMYRGA